MYLTRNESETKELGRRLGERLKSGDVVFLYGELGSGKTTLVKGIASVHGIKERDITSASFTIIAEHSGTVPFYHIDLYRVQKERVDELGLHEYLNGEGISVIEWAEKAEGEMQDNKIKVHIRYTGESSRSIEIKGIEI